MLQFNRLALKSLIFSCSSYDNYWFCMRGFACNICKFKIYISEFIDDKRFLSDLNSQHLVLNNLKN